MAPLRYVPGPRVTAKPVSWARSWPPPAAVSHQARLLRNLGLVTGTRNGKNIAGPSTMRETYLEPFSSLRLDYLMSLKDERTGVDALMRAVAAGTGKGPHWDHSFLVTSGPLMRRSSGNVAAIMPRATTIPPAVSR